MRLICLIIVLLSSCFSGTEKPESEIEDEPYFVMDCMRWFRNGNIRWHCSADPDTSLIKGQISIYYEKNDDASSLEICTVNAVLNSGNESIDSLVNGAEEDHYTCTYLPRSFGEFSWDWDSDTVLNLFWDGNSTLSLKIPHSPSSIVFQGEAYYILNQKQE